MHAALALLAVLGGCALPPAQHSGAGTELARVAATVLDTAYGHDDARSVLRRALGAGPRDRTVLVAGHRFLLAPATLDAIPEGTGRYRWLLAQSLELAEQTCLRFIAREEGWRVETGVGGAVTLGWSAEEVQWVNVGIELRQGCIVALHVEQASALERR